MTSLPTVAPHIALQEMVDVGKKYGYYLKYGVQLSYWVDGEQYLITVPEPNFVNDDD